jgi:Cu+-exporting ATPase
VSSATTLTALPVTEPDAAPLPFDRHCRHCADLCDDGTIVTDDGIFCCHGCLAVFRVLAANELEAFYRCEIRPTLGSPAGADDRDRSRFAPLDDPAHAADLIEFDDGRFARVTWMIPALHCAACVTGHAGAIPGAQRQR